MPEYESHSFDDVAKALKKIRKQHKKGKPLVWTGPDRLHHAIAATSPEPSWYFSDEGMEYMRDQGHGFWDVYTMVAFQVGFHNGTVREEEHSRSWRESTEREAEIMRLLAKKEENDEQ